MTDLDHIIALGRALYGERWQRPAASAIGCSEKLIRQWISGQCAPREHHVRALRKAARRQAEEVCGLLLEALEEAEGAD
jgi:hypothetical protein